jgi:predicted MPP superfamily phosphohydrolase
MFLAFLFLIPLGALLLGYATLREPYRPVFKRHPLRLPAGWPSLSIVHISDLHVRANDPRLVRTQRAALANLAPDLLCVTGDMCEKVRDIHLLIDLLKTVKPRYGTFVVLGNHEHNAPLPSRLQREHDRGWLKLLTGLIDVVAPRVRSDGDEEGHAMADALVAAGITVLHNEGLRITHNGQSLWIAGCDSAWAGHADVGAALAGRAPDEPCLALIHEPDLAFEAQAHGADLILAGHTHGGQVRLPLIGAPYTLRMDERIGIAAGFQRIEAALLHITTGLGHTIPLRFGCPPEVVWLDCQPELLPTALHQADKQIFQRLVRRHQAVQPVAAVH